MVGNNKEQAKAHVRGQLSFWGKQTESRSLIHLYRYILTAEHEKQKNQKAKKCCAPREVVNHVLIHTARVLGK